MKIEDFVKKHRDEFDDREPPSRVWNVIAGSIPDTKKTGLWNSIILWRAAAVIFMALSLFMLIPKGQYFSPKNDNTLKEFHDVEKFYNQQISYKVRLIDEYQKADGLNGFTQDFHQLEAMYMVLKEEMRNRPSDKVKDALVLNLLVRIDLLNQQIQKLEESERDEVDETSNNLKGT